MDPKAILLREIQKGVQKNLPAPSSLLSQLKQALLSAASLPYKQISIVLVSIGKTLWVIISFYPVRIAISFTLTSLVVVFVSALREVILLPRQHRQNRKEKNHIQRDGLKMINCFSKYSNSKPEYAFAAYKNALDSFFIFLWKKYFSYQVFVHILLPLSILLAHFTPLGYFYHEPASSLILTLLSSFNDSHNHFGRLEDEERENWMPGQMCLENFFSGRMGSGSFWLDVLGSGFSISVSRGRNFPQSFCLSN